MGDQHGAATGRPGGRYFITGASSGIGAAVAAMLAGRGDDLWLLSRSSERAEELKRSFPEAHILIGDLAAPLQLETSLITSTLPTLLNGLLHIAGVIDFSDVVNLSAGHVLDLMTVNLVGPMILTRALLPALRAGRGLVVLANSTASQSGAPARSAYAASKAGLRAFADALRAEETSTGVRVTTVYPGRTDTPMQKKVYEHEHRPYDAAELMRPEVVAKAIVDVIDLPVDTMMRDLTLVPSSSHRPD